MTAIATYAQFQTLLNNADTYQMIKTAAVSSNSILNSFWTSNPNPGATPSTAAALSASTTGALNSFKDVTSATGSVYVGKIKALSHDGSAMPCTFMLIDRLSNTGGLDSTVTSAQTTNLPTAALTRYTNGTGVFLGLEIYTTIGTSGTTVQCSYTNQAGTAGQTTKPTQFGISSYNNAGRMIVCPLQDGDTGVRSVQSVTVAQSSGTAGNFGVTLFKPLFFFVGDVSHLPYVAGTVPPLGGGFQFTPIVNGACLSMLGSSNATTIAGFSCDTSFLVTG